MSDCAPPAGLPAWAGEMVELYESQAASQFILHGNVHDRFLFPQSPRSGSLVDFLLAVLLPRFDIVFGYDLGRGLRVERGGQIVSTWPSFQGNGGLPQQPRPAIEALTSYFRYSANLARLGHPRLQVACFVKAAELLAPAGPGGLHHDLDALALQMREWSEDPLLTEHSLVTVLIAESPNDLHPLLAHNPRAARIKLPLPTTPELLAALQEAAPRFPKAFSHYEKEPQFLAAELTGATQHAVENLLKRREYRAEPLRPADLARLKKQLVEEECAGLIEFIESGRTLEDLHGQEKLKAWLRQDIALWRRGDLRALPMGYLVCGPVGTGKTFLVECLAGEAGVPVVKIKNFRDRWVGSTEANLEKIFRLLQALSRCIVFIDEADQALGKRDGGSNDSGLSGRIYAMMAAEMSRPENRGRILWVLASSRPDLIEVDLKRPGRVDLKIPLFPTATPGESFDLVRVLCAREGLELPESERGALEALMPVLLTPGAAQALAGKVYRSVQVAGSKPADALKACLQTYQNPVAPEVMNFQIGLAVAEASDLDFVPEAFRGDRRTQDRK
jgi:hypothetical protein